MQELPINTVVLGDSLEVMRTWPDNVFDGICTDPPYGLFFMNSHWDKGVPGPEFWAEMLRICKPGAYLVAFGGSRTHHRLWCAIEDAGWNIKDCLMWVYGSSWPKSLDISKAIDKEAGAEREIVGPKMRPDGKPRAAAQPNGPGGNFPGDDRPWKHDPVAIERTQSVTAPATEAATLWDGYGTALKPAYEPICLAQKPTEGNYAQNALKWNCGGLNIRRCRISTNNKPLRINTAGREGSFGMGSRIAAGITTEGRWPANFILSCACEGEGHEAECPVRILDEQSDFSSGKRPNEQINHNSSYWKRCKKVPTKRQMDSGTASRFFYTAKASQSERNCGKEGDFQNIHATVKPIKLLQYLLKLIKQPNFGIILDPFCGSGSTLLACQSLEIPFIGIEKEPEWAAIATERLNRKRLPLFEDEYKTDQNSERLEPGKPSASAMGNGQGGLFGEE